MITIVFIPPTHSLIASSMDMIFWSTAMRIATMEASNAAWNKATDASEAANASNIPLNDNGEVFIKVIKA